MNPDNSLAKQTVADLPDQVSRVMKTGTEVGRPQPHGGTLRNGKKGNPGGGRPPSVVRQRCRDSFYDRVNVLEKLADHPYTEARDRIRAIDTLGRYGLTTGRLDVEEVRLRLARTIQKVEELADSTTAERILQALDTIWNPARERPTPDVDNPVDNQTPAVSLTPLSPDSDTTPEGGGGGPPGGRT